MAIPSKVFEYMRYEAWLLALAEPRSATAQLLRDTPADVVRPDDVDALAGVLRAATSSIARAAGRSASPATALQPARAGGAPVRRHRRLLDATPTALEAHRRAVGEG